MLWVLRTSLSRCIDRLSCDEGRIQAHLDEVVRSTAEEALKALLDLEADRLVGVRKYERSEGRKDSRGWQL